jgi:hypothetical protein
VAGGAAAPPAPPLACDQGLTSSATGHAYAPLEALVPACGSCNSLSSMAAAPDAGASAAPPGCAPWWAQLPAVGPPGQEVIVALCEGAAALPAWGAICSALQAPTAGCPAGAHRAHRQVSAFTSNGPQAVCGRAVAGTVLVGGGTPAGWADLTPMPWPDAAARALAADLQTLLPGLVAAARARAAPPGAVGRVVVGLRLGAGVPPSEPGLVVAVAARSSDEGAAALKCVVDAIGALYA